MMKDVRAFHARARTMRIPSLGNVTMERTRSIFSIHGIAVGALNVLILFSSDTAIGEEAGGAIQRNDAPLSLEEAVRLAVTAADPSVRSSEERAAALEQRAVADAQLPDPTASVAAANLPVDTFRLNQEAMTQIQFGLRQEIPRGETLELNGIRRQAQSDGERARSALRSRQIELAVRTAWLDRFYLEHALGFVADKRNAVSELLGALSASFATGDLTSQDILRAELELSLLDDRLIEIEQMDARIRADLARYIGVAAMRPMPDTLPDLDDPESLPTFVENLVRHPAVITGDAAIAVENADVGLAEEAYKPSWAMEAGYGLRAGGRADFATIGVSLSIPLFTGMRQDRNLEAAVRERSAAQLDRSATLLDLRRELERAYADWTHLGERVALYRTAATARAHETAEASITTYANRLTDFPELIRSQLAELDTELKHLELRTQRAKAWAVLNYLKGDTP